MRSDSLDACGSIYRSAEPLPMDFSLPCTRLVHDHKISPRNSWNYVKHTDPKYILTHPLSFHTEHTISVSLHRIKHTWHHTLCF